MAKASSAGCSIEHCDRPVECPESGLCKRCYGALYYWKKYKTVTDIMKRKSNLRLYMSRMDAAEPTVVELPRRKRASR